MVLVFLVQGSYYGRSVHSPLVLIRSWGGYIAGDFGAGLMPRYSIFYPAVRQVGPVTVTHEELSGG